MRRILLTVAACLLGVGTWAQVFNRAPLASSQYTELPLGAIRPQGWLLEQVQRQANGLTGHLDEV